MRNVCGKGEKIHRGKKKTKISYVNIEGIQSLWNQICSRERRTKFINYDIDNVTTFFVLYRLHLHRHCRRRCCLSWYIVLCLTLCFYYFMNEMDIDIREYAAWFLSAFYTRVLVPLLRSIDFQLLLLFTFRIRWFKIAILQIASIFFLTTITKKKKRYTTTKTYN